MTGQINDAESLIDCQPRPKRKIYQGAFEGQL